MARASWQEQIERVGRGMHAAPPGTVAAVCVDDDQEKIGRFRKSLSLMPHIEVMDEAKGPTKGVYTFRVKRKPDAE